MQGTTSTTTTPRRRIGGAKNGVISGENKMKIDEGKSVVKVLNAEAPNSPNGTGLQVYSRRLKRNQIGGVSEKRKTSKSEHVEVIERKQPIQIRKTKSESHKGDEIEKNPIVLRKSRSDSHTFKDLGVCKEKVNSISVGQIKNEKEEELVVAIVNGDKEDQVEEAEELDEDEEEEEGEEEDIVMEIEEKKIDVKEINLPEGVHKEIVNQDKKIDQIHETPIPISSNVIKKPPKVIHHPVIQPEFTKPPPISDEFVRYPEPQSKLQNIVDLVMWRDVSKSAFVFGIGTFVLLSSSYTKDINFSIISAMSYMGLLYLATKFFYKSILCRGSVGNEESNETYMIGEEEAIWFIEVILPYLNEFLFKIRSLFSGDPATTLKLAVLLFVLARCGSSITTWKMIKLGFFGIFTVPKVCSSYATQLNGYGMFWIRRFRDAWESCSHKKGVVAAVFTLFWNLSSLTARIWAAFMLIVAFKYYQQCMIRDRDTWEEEQQQQTVAKEKKV